MERYSSGIYGHAIDGGFARPVLDQIGGLLYTLYPHAFINLLVERRSCDLAMSLPLGSVRLSNQSTQLYKVERPPTVPTLGPKILSISRRFLEVIFERIIIQEHLTRRLGWSRKITTTLEDLRNSLGIAQLEVILARGNEQNGIAQLLVSSVAIPDLPSSPIEAGEGARPERDPSDQLRDFAVDDQPQGVPAVEGEDD